MPIQAFLLAAAVCATPSTGGDLSRFAPEGTVAWVQTTDHLPLLEQGLEHPLVAKLLAHPIVKADLEKKGQDPAAALTAIEAVLGESPLEVAAALSSGGFAIGALESEGGAPRGFALLRGADVDAMEDALDALIQAAASFGGAAEIASQDRSRLGASVVSAWTIGRDGVVAALTDDGVVFATKGMEDLRACTRGAGRAADLRVSRRAMGEATGTFAWLDLDALEGSGQLDDLREAVSDPGMHFVLGPAFTYACAASTLGLALDASADGIELRSRAEGVDAGPGAATFPTEGTTRAPLPARSETEVARAVIHRDVATLLAERTELFAPRAQPGIAEGLANFALLLGGSDAVDDLFGAIEPRMVLLAETVEFDDVAHPDVELPAACMIARFEDPAVNGPRVVAGFQSLIAITNVQRAQNGQPGLVLGLEPLAGSTMTVAKLPPPAEGDGVDLAYNLAPGCALVGDTIVMGTHHALVKRVVERLANDRTEPDDRARIDHLRLSAPAVADLIRQNRDLLVMQMVLNEGKTQSRSESEVDMLAAIADAIASVDVSTKATDGTIEATIRVGLSR